MASLSAAGKSATIAEVPEEMSSRMLLPDFLTEQDGEIRLAGSRIGLAHVMRAYQRGDAAEMIALRFPTIVLATVHKIIGYYLEN